MDKSGMGAGNIGANLSVMLNITGESASRRVLVGIAMDEHILEVYELNGPNVVDVNIE